MFFKASVGPGVHIARSDSRSLTFIEEYWRLIQQPTDPLCSEFKCVRLYSTTPKVNYVIDAWRILGPAPIMRNAVHPTIPFFAHYRSRRNNASGSIQAQQKTQNLAKVMGAHSGLSMCGP